MKKQNRTKQLTETGQALWLDYIHRDFLHDGDLQRCIDEDGVGGLTSNPTIFDQAISEGDRYDDAITSASADGAGPEEVFHTLAVDDIQHAADILRPVYERTEGKDGYVSLEVSPHLADDTEGTVNQALELWERVDRPNLFIKVPGTKAGVPAIRRLIAGGINVNVTLLFGLERYDAVAKAYCLGLQDRLQKNLPVDSIASVASFFLSRVDVLADRQLGDYLDDHPSRSEDAAPLKGSLAVALARLAYEQFSRRFQGAEFAELKAKGAQPQRLLWASTGTKNPEERDVRYVEALIGPETITTLPLKTFRAFRDHGDPTPRLHEDVEDARAIVAAFKSLGLDPEAMADDLEKEGVQKFIQPYDHLLEGLEKKIASVDSAAADVGFVSR